MLTVLGTTTVDIFVRGIEQMPERGDDEFSNNSLVWLDNAVVAALGGNGANAAFAAAALGEQTRLWSALGTDALSDLALGWLKQGAVGVDELYIAADQGASTTVILTDAALRRNSFHHHGPARGFMPHDKSVGGPGDWLLRTSYSLLPHWRGPAAQDLLRKARQSGVRVALDPGPMLGEAPTRQELEPLLPFVDVLLCNEFELREIMSGDAQQGIAWALAGGVAVVVVKMGAQGALVCAAQGPSVAVPGFTVPVAGTVGAGDSFDAGFIYAFSRGATISAAARFANAVAALVVSAPRGILAAPDLGQVEAFLRENDEVV